MPPEPRAVLFDLDDTLYPRRRFVLSAFAAIAAHLAARFDVSPQVPFRTLCAAYRGGRRGREIQHCLSAHGWPASLLSSLVDVSRAHTPALRLPPASREVLDTLRSDWRIGVVTNGLPAVQARKVEALGLRRWVDTVVYANAIGSGRGKPEAAPFEAALLRLGVEPGRAVFVGDDETCDVRGAMALGMHAVRVSRHPAADEPHTAADAIVGSLRGAAVAVAHLVNGQEWRRHVA